MRKRNGILQPEYYLVTKYEFNKNKDLQIKNILEKIGEVYFIKPCNAGSSVGFATIPVGIFGLLFNNVSEDQQSKVRCQRRS